jgi:haloalkane dehalogenase
LTLHARVAEPEGAVAGDVLLLHGVPESSFMWRALLPALAGAGWRGVAPDLPGYGESQVDPPATWERQVEAVDAFVRASGLERLVLVVHDWGGLIGLRWACDHPAAVRALVISGTGFFPDGKWHGIAEGMRAPGTGEELMASMTREGFDAMMRQVSRGMTDEALDAYWTCMADDEHRRAVLELYRSGDFEKVAPYEGRLGALGVPTLVLWGAGDGFAPPAGAERFAAEIPGSELVVLEDAGHFVFEDAPEACAAAVTGFLARLHP